MTGSGKQQSTILKLDGLSIGYNDGRPLVSNIVAEAGAGEMIALVGENGSGKSTLLRSIAALHTPLQGTISLHGKPLQNYRKVQLSRSIAFVTTASYFFENLKVEEVVSLGRHPYTNWWGSLGAEDRERIDASIQFVGLENFRKVDLNRLSDGERQRAMIARALAQDTDILLLDEPMAFLDQPNRAAVASVLHHLRSAGRTLIYSTHDVDSIFQFADKCWLLHDGQLTGGSPEDLVLMGAFNSMYASSGLVFNEDEIRFISERTLHGLVKLDIPDPRLRLWTVRALQRLGIQHAENESGREVATSISLDEKGSGWCISGPEGAKTVQTLYDLAQYLTVIF